MFGVHIAVDVIIDDDHRADPANSETTGGQERPLTVRAGLFVVQVEFIYQNLPDFSPPRYMAGGVLTKLDHVSATWFC
ncbi:hypothetical protein SDC9_187905 [bioreactor metagenome]|uniref:Uncharacterized protein n=1 Tax=bioreactor metagenome TaxID=1076179 RepID=A0A645HQ59_9ZZZZ